MGFTLLESFLPRPATLSSDWCLKWQNWVYINCMKLGARFVLALGIGCLMASVVRGNDSSSAANPYVAIPARNIFNLVPIPTNDPMADVKPPDPPAKITPNGIMSLFGTPQVLFKVATPPKPGQPPQDQSYCLSEGDRQDGIEVVQIDQVARVITFDNHGIVQKIPLVAAGETGDGGSGGSPAGGGSPGLGGPGQFYHRGGGGGGFSSQPGSPTSSDYSASASSANDNANNGSSPDVSPTSVEGAQAKLNAIINDPNHLTPEAQVLLMEANRQQLQAAGDPTAVLIPPTEITDQVQGGTDGGTDPSTPAPGQ